MDMKELTHVFLGANGSKPSQPLMRVSLTEGSRLFF